MSVVARKGKKRTVYWVATSYRGHVHWKRSGTDRREAQRLDDEREKQKKAGTFRPEYKDGQRTTVRAYCEAWLDKRSNRTAKDDRQRLTDYVLSRDWFVSLRVAEVEPAHIIRLLGELNETHLSASSVANTYGALRTMFRDARIERLTFEDPCVVPKGTIKRREKKERGVYSREEVQRLLECDAIDWPTFVLLALAFYTGMREGEVCGRRWKDWCVEVEPLGCLNCFDQYNGLPLKTDHPRKIPVHPELAEVLTEWFEHGFELYTTRPPMPDDFIVPNVSARANVPNHTKSTCYKAFKRACQVAGVEAKTLHATRHTFVSWIRRAGGDKAKLEQITHNAAGDIVDQYTHWDWEPLCETVEKLDFGLRQIPERRPKTTGNGGGGATGSHPQSAVEYDPGTSRPRLRFPASPQLSQHKKSGSRKPGQSQSQKVDSAKLRRDRLARLAEIDPKAARPGLALCRALEAAKGVADGKRNAKRDLRVALADACEAIGGGS